MKLVRYGQAFKEKAGARLLPPHSAALDLVVREVGIGAGTLERWRVVRVQVDWRKQPIVTSRIDGRDYAVVNVNRFADIAADRLERSAVAFDDEDAARVKVVVASVMQPSAEYVERW